MYEANEAGRGKWLRMLWLWWDCRHTLPKFIIIKIKTNYNPFSQSYQKSILSQFFLIFKMHLYFSTWHSNCVLIVILALNAWSVSVFSRELNHLTFRFLRLHSKPDVQLLITITSHRTGRGVCSILEFKNMSSGLFRILKQDPKVPTLCLYMARLKRSSSKIFTHFICLDYSTFTALNTKNR